MKPAYSPQYRLIKRPADAEWNAAEYLKSIDVQRVRITPPTQDGGWDIEGDGIKAEVKAHAARSGVELVRALRGVLRERETGGFFSLGGYTRGAIGFADENGVCLWEIDYQGKPTPVNGAARQFVRERQRERKAAEAAETAERERQERAERERVWRESAKPSAKERDPAPQRRVRCPICGSVVAADIGSVFTCSCGRRLRVPEHGHRPEASVHSPAPPRNGRVDQSVLRFWRQRRALAIAAVTVLVLLALAAVLPLL